jgi:hypothetical protein
MLHHINHRADSPPTTAVIYFPRMAPKKLTENPNKKRKATLDSVLSTVERGFADLEGKMDRGFAAVADDITDIKSKMATKDKTSRLHPRHVVPKPTQAYEPEVPVKVRESGESGEKAMRR